MQTENDGRNDFNFFIGNWTVKHRKLKELLKIVPNGMSSKAPL